MLASDSVQHYPGADSATSITNLPDESASDSGLSYDSRTCLLVAIIITPILGVCILIPIVVIALRLLRGSDRKHARRPLVVVPALRPADGQKSDKTDAYPFCGDRTSLCVCPVTDTTSRTKFVVLTAGQPRRSPGGGYQQIVQTPSTSVNPCQCYGRNACPVDDFTDRTAFHLDADVDGDFV